MEHQIISARQLTPVLWKNGLGSTRVIATEEPRPVEPRPVEPLPVDDRHVDQGSPGPDVDGGTSGPGFLWRLSLADLVDDSAFSALPGVDRVFTLVTPGPVELHVGSQAYTLTRGCQVAFAGEEPVRALLGEAGPQQALNVMVDRSRARGEVRVDELADGWSDLEADEADEADEVDDDAADVAVFVLSGSVTLSGGGQLLPGHVLRPHGPARIHARGPAVVARVRVTAQQGVRGGESTDPSAG